MLQQLLPRSILALGLAAILTPLASEAQVREVVSKQVSVGRSEATLNLEFSDDGALEVSFQDGSVLIDGERIGSFEPGGELDLAWRELLGQAVSLEDGPLSAALTDWTVPADLAGSLADVAQEIDRTLDESLNALEIEVDATDGAVSVSVDNLDEIRAEIRAELLRDLDIGDLDEIRIEIGEDLRAEIEREFGFGNRDRDRDRDEGESILTAPFRSVARAAGGLLENLFTVLILGLIGAGAVMFAGDNVDAIAETARRSPRRAAMVGFAGSFLLLPAWILGFVALCISIIGIPVALAWLPLFPIAAGLAAVVGYLAVARNTGEWLADSDYPWTGWIRKSNPLITMVGGLVGLMALFAAANVLSIVPFSGFIRGLLGAAAVMVTFLAVQIGFGAVLLTRAGRRREHWSTNDADAAWEAAMSVDVEEEEVKSTEEPDDVGGEEGENA
jgi:hypothetical protein